MKGPDLLNDLFGIVLRFRENKVAFIGHISKIYHRIRIPEADQHMHRFLLELIVKQTSTSKQC